MANDGPDPRPSIPAGPIAIEHLARSVDALRADIKAFREDITSAIKRLEANQQLLVNEHTLLIRQHAAHEERITKLEIRVRTAAKIVRKKKGKAGK